LIDKFLNTNFINTYFSFQNLMSKYEKDPEDPMAKFSKATAQDKSQQGKNLSATVARVKTSLHGGRESVDQHGEETSRKRRRSGVSGSNLNGPKKSKREREAEEARKKRLELAAKAPKALSFEELVRAAKEKHGAPVRPAAGAAAKVKEAEFERPMTQKEKEEYLREQKSQLRKMGKLSKEEKKAEPTSKAALQPAPSKPTSAPVKHVPVTKPPPPPEPVKKKQPPPVAGPEYHPAVVKTMKKAPTKPEQQAKRDQKRPARPKRPVASSSSSSSRRNRIESDEEDNGVQYDEYEDEEDSDMDDFIDDSEAKLDISAEIRNIFGYDRRKFRHEDPFDDRGMENNRFADVMKEEARSARIGKMEDLEDMRREEEEKRRKRDRKKAKMKANRR